MSTIRRSAGSRPSGSRRATAAASAERMSIAEYGIGFAESYEKNQNW